MSATKSTVLHRKLLRKAWHLTWLRKELWIFGIFAAIISTGGVIDVAFTAVKKAERGSTFFEQLLSSGFLVYELGSSYIQQLLLLGHDRVATLLTATVLIAFGLFALGILAQGALALGVKDRKFKDPLALRKSARTHFWSLVLLAVLAQVAMGLILMLMGLLLLLITLDFTLLSVLTYVILMTVLIPSIVVVQIIYMFAVMDVVHKNEHPLDALLHGWHLFKRQWLGALEFGVLLFLVALFSALLLLVMISLLTIPYTLVFTGTLLSGSYTLFLVANVLYGLILLLVVLGIGGALVTFQYTAWYLFFKRALHKTHGKKPFSKILRITHP